MSTAHHSTTLSSPEHMFERAGTTFAIYGADESTDRLIPLELIPFITDASGAKGLKTGAMLSLDAQPGRWETFAYFAA